MAEVNQLVRLTGGIEQLNALLLLSMDQPEPHSVQVITPGDLQADFVTGVTWDGPNHILLYTATGDTVSVYYPRLPKYYAIVTPYACDPKSVPPRLAGDGNRYYLQVCNLGSGDSGVVLHSNEVAHTPAVELNTFASNCTQMDTRYYNLQGDDIGYPVIPSALITRESHSLDIQYISFLSDNGCVAVDSWGIVEGMVDVVFPTNLYCNRRTAVFEGDKKPVEWLGGLEFSSINAEYVPEVVELFSLIVLLDYLSTAEKVSHSTRNAIPVLDVIRHLSHSEAVTEALKPLLDDHTDIAACDIHMSHALKMTDVDKMQCRAVYLHTKLANVETGLPDSSIDALYNWSCLLWSRGETTRDDTVLTTSLLSDHTRLFLLRQTECTPNPDKLIEFAAKHLTDQNMIKEIANAG